MYFCGMDIAEIAHVSLPENHIIKMLRNEAAKAESYGHLTPKQLAVIYKNKWFQLLVPKAIAGAECDLPTFCLFVEYLASIDGSLAWCINLGAGANMFAGYMNQDTAHSLFNDPVVCIAGSGAKTGTAQVLGSSYVINGTWRYASGAHHATHFSLNARLGTEENAPYLSFVIPKEQVQIVQAWDAFGLKATSSHDFIINHGVVPKTYAFDLTKPPLHELGDLYRFPFPLLAQINILAVTTGLARRFLELSKEVYTSKHKGRSIHFDQVCDELEAAFEERRQQVYRKLNLLWMENKRQAIDEIKVSSTFTQTIVKAANASRALVDGLFPYLGMQSILYSSEINRVWRDFKVASQHLLLRPGQIFRD